MLKYIIRRVLASLPVLFGVLVVTFTLARLIPGDPCKAILGEKATVEVCEKFMRDKGLDQPIVVQFGYYVKDLARGDFGDIFVFTGLLPIFSSSGYRQPSSWGLLRSSWPH